MSLVVPDKRAPEHVAALSDRERQARHFHLITNLVRAAD